MEFLIDVPMDYDYDWSLDPTPSKIYGVERILEKMINASVVKFMHNGHRSTNGSVGDVYCVTFKDNRDATLFALTTKFKIL